MHYTIFDTLRYLTFWDWATLGAIVAGVVAALLLYLNDRNRK